MRVVAPLQADLPIAYATARNKAVSLDIPWHTKITATPASKPSPSPAATAAPSSKLLRSPSPPPSTLTTRPQLAALKDKLAVLLEKRERINDIPNSPGFDMDAARQRNERFIKEIRTEIQRLKNPS